MLTEAAGGEFYDLAGPKTDLAFCPLRDIDDDADLTWAVGWIEVLCELNGLKFAPRHRNAVAEAVLRLQFSPTRTLTELSAQRAGHRDPRCPAALHRHGAAGLAAGCGLRRCSATAGFFRFETENLLQLDDKAVIPVLLYLFRRIEQRLDGSPTLILLDEAWSYLQHELFRSPPEGLAQDDASEERRRCHGDAADQRYRELRYCGRRARKLPDEDPAAECGSEESRLTRVLRRGSV